VSERDSDVSRKENACFLNGCENKRKKRA